MAFFDDITRLLQSTNTPDAHSACTSPKTVVIVSNVLTVSEFEVFRIAYRQWFGVEAADQDLHQSFTRYIFSRQMPHWVRHFCATILSLHRSGSLEAHEFTGQRDRRAGMSKNILIA